MAVMLPGANADNCHVPMLLQDPIRLHAGIDINRIHQWKGLRPEAVAQIKQHIQAGTSDAQFRFELALPYNPPRQMCSLMTFALPFENSVGIFRCTMHWGAHRVLQLWGDTHILVRLYRVPVVVQVNVDPSFIATEADLEQQTIPLVFKHGDMETCVPSKLLDPFLFAAEEFFDRARFGHHRNQWVQFQFSNGHRFHNSRAFHRLNLIETPLKYLAKDDMARLLFPLTVQKYTFLLDLMGNKQKDVHITLLADHIKRVICEFIGPMCTDKYVSTLFKLANWRHGSHNAAGEWIPMIPRECIWRL
jgi:hypothetical protein